MTRLLWFACSVIFLIGLTFGSVRDWYKEDDKNKVNCEEADEYKCMNNIRWETRCEECKKYSCPKCRDNYLSCGELTIDSSECKTEEVKRGCPKTCGICKCILKDEL